MQKLILFCTILHIIPFVYPSKFQRGGGRITLPIVNNNGILYTGLQISTTTTLRALINTGSADLWVPGVGCDPNMCHGKTIFDGSKSPSYTRTNRTFVSEFAGSSVIGRVGIDDVRIGNILMKSLEFGEAVKSSSPLLYLYYDGSLGLGPQSKPSVGVTFLQRVANLTENPVFYLSLREKTGSLTIGDVGKYRGDMVWNKVLRAERWQIPADSISLNGTRLCDAPCQIEFNTALEVTAVPQEYAAELYKILGAEGTEISSIHTVDCGKVATFPDLVFSFGGGREFRLSPGDYIVRQKWWKRDVCWLSITGYEGIDRWVIGASQHRTLHVVYNWGEKSVGIAHAV